MDAKTQEAYYDRIVKRYMEFCAVAGRGPDSLDQAFAAMSLSNSNGSRAAQMNPPGGAVGVMPAASPTGVQNTKELGILLMAMRKLREALLASGRVDSFAKEATIFIIRAAILTSTYESYYSGLERLLYSIHPKAPLSASELHEFLGFLILDTACRQGEYQEAFALRNRWQYRDDRVEGVVMALVRDDWTKFWYFREVVDGYQRALLGWAEGAVRKHALKCLGSSYFSAEKSFVEKCAGRKWDELKTKDELGWELEGTKVTIRRVKKR